MSTGTLLLDGRGPEAQRVSVEMQKEVAGRTEVSISF